MKPKSIVKVFDFNSIKLKLLLGLCIMMLPLIILMIYSNNYSSKVIRNQAAQSNMNVIMLYLRQMDHNLLNINNYLLNVAAQDTNLYGLERMANNDPDAYNLSKIRLLNKLSGNSTDSGYIDYYFVYSINNNDLMFTPGTIYESNYDKRDKMLQDATKYIKNEEIPDYNALKNWRFIDFNGDSYLIQILRIGKMYIGALINENKLKNSLKMLDFGNKGNALLTSNLNKPVGDSEFIRYATQHQFNFRFSDKSYTFTGDSKKYMLIGNRSMQGDFNMVVLLPDEEVLKTSPFLQRIAVFVAAGMIFIIFFALFFIRRTILAPLNMIVRGMRGIRTGNLETRILSTRTSTEFTLVNQTFNTMASQIQELKINVYEEKLKHQHAELKQLQLQINPHFFLNALNTIYYLAHAKNFALIQDMSTSLIQYFRFMFRSKSDFVSLMDEVKHTRNYLRIQELRFPHNLEFQLSIPDELMDFQVPPLIIQSFVENSIKHSQIMDYFLKIEVIVSQEKDSNSEYIQIRITDTGDGFPQSVLQLLQYNSDLTNEEGDHIGIWNMNRRLDLLYQDQAKLAFSNAKENQGAIVEIRLPLNQHYTNGGDRNV